MRHGCDDCGAPLAHDQRYCVVCGARRGPLPAALAALLGDSGPAHGARPQEPPAPGVPDGLKMPTPRAAAVAVMAVLAFGVVVGTLVSPAEDSAASAPIVVAVAPPAAEVPAPAPEPEAPAEEPAPAAVEVAPAEAAPEEAPAESAPQVEPPALDTPQLPPVNHVFLIVLSGQGYEAAFGPDSQAPYLATTLRGQGELISNYYAVAPSGLGNGIALISGQGPNPETAANCPTYIDLASDSVDADGQVHGSGCVYPAKTQTLADQLIANGNTWRAYVEDTGSGGEGVASTCRHPALGSEDADALPRPGAASVTWRDPFVYFHSVIDSPACADLVVGLDRLATDLADARSAPSLSYIVPSRCHDGSDAPCAPDQPAGLPAADAFLRTVVTQILASPAYKDGGLIAITFDKAPQAGPHADPSSCCDTPAYPNLPATAFPVSADPDAPSLAGRTSVDSDALPPAITGGSVSPTGGGGRVGLLLISPFVKPGTENVTSYYNHFSLLASIEGLFSLTRLGYAASPALPTFDRTIYSAAP
jgi:hypothetical protein